MILTNLFCCPEKVFIHYEYMDEWEKFNKTSLPKKMNFLVT